MKAFIIQLVLAFILVKFPLGQIALQKVSDFVTKALSYGADGVSFVFGDLTKGNVFAVNVLANIIFVSALVGALYYLGVIGFVVKMIGGVIGKILGTSKVESFVAVANMFLGQTESPILVSKYLGGMNKSEIMLVLVSGMGSWIHSVSMYAGTNDALVQWWFGHNAVAFVFTVAIIAQIYYFLPKESGQPIFSYKLSLFSFWGLMFVYLWAGGHHLIYSTVPDWMQTMGSIFSIVLILPSWGSAINMLLTMRGEWGQLRDNPLIKFMVLASTFYMFSTLEGPILSIKSVNALAHFTDWIPGHVHDGTLGWVGFMTMAALYHMTPRIFKRELYSKSLMEAQFWIQTTGIVLYFASMWIAGITQGMMWRATDEYGNLAYSFIDTVTVLVPYYWIRAIGGLLYLIGFFMFTYNIIKSMSSSKPIDREPVSASPMAA
jgi:cytochrome c oxidase cbb3-type subunit 1